MIIADLQDLKIVLDLYATQYAATDRLWGYFSSVTLAILGFTVASDKMAKSLAEATVVVMGYLAFCAGNFMALFLSQQQLLEISSVVGQVAGKVLPSFVVHHPLSVWRISIFYFAVVLLVCAGIVYITHQRNPEILKRR